MGFFFCVFFCFDWVGVFPSPSRLLILTHNFFLTLAFSFLSLVPLGWEANKQLGDSLAAGQVHATTSVAIVKILIFFFLIQISNTCYVFFGSFFRIAIMVYSRMYEQ